MGKVGVNWLAAKHTDSCRGVVFTEPIRGVVSWWGRNHGAMGSGRE